MTQKEGLVAPARGTWIELAVLSLLPMISLLTVCGVKIGLQRFLTSFGIRVETRKWSGRADVSRRIQIQL